jgi:MoaA/NifB/PqqE/SkfB family radical SAM enzyme
VNTVVGAHTVDELDDLPAFTSSLGTVFWEVLFLVPVKRGRCEFASVCGGSRARAWTVTGDYLAEEPYCLHEPCGTLRQE